MKTLRVFGMVALAVVLATSTVRAQEGPKPGPEHDILKKHVGDWTLTMKMGPGMEAKGTVTYKMDLGGLWLTSTMESELFGAKFTGKGMDTYCPTKKKYVAIWIDSMSTGPVLQEGTYDAAKKTLTLDGTGPGHDGKETKYKSTTEFADDDTVNFTMWVGETKDPTFTIVYKRKK